MDWYAVFKTLHILSAAILFGGGLAIAFYMFVGLRSGETVTQLFAARVTVLADFCFTLPAVILQPLTGVYLISNGGFDWGARWLLWVYSLYALAGICWLPVVWIQMRLRRLLKARLDGEPFSELEVKRLFRTWFILGWPAFSCVLVIYALMVIKPA